MVKKPGTTIVDVVPELRVWSSIRVVRSRRAQHVFELLEFLTLAHRDKDVSGLEPDLRLRIELHGAVLATHSERERIDMQTADMTLRIRSRASRK